MSNTSNLNLPEEPESVWSSGTSSPLEHRASDGVIPSSADVCVIGGGIAGLAAAAQLSAEGVDVVILETREVAAGATGRSSATVSVLQDTLVQEIADTNGSKIASQYARANEFGRKWITQQVTAESIECGLQERRAVTYVTDERNRHLIESEANILQSVGVAARIDEVDLPYPTAGAVVVEEQGQFDPVRFANGLAEALTRRGVIIERGVRALGVDDRGKGATVDTTHGSIDARHVIVTTGLPFLDRGLFFARTVPESSHVVACDVEQLPPDGMYISADGPTRSLRTAEGPDGETLLLVGGEGHKTGQGGDTLQRQERLVAWADAHFGVRTVTHRFMAQDYRTPDRRPFAGPIHPGATSTLIATGFNKWGFTNSAAAAAVLTAEVTGESPPEWAEVFSTSRLPLRGLGPMLWAGLDVQKNLISGWSRALIARQQREADEGEVVGRGLKPVAIAGGADDARPCAVSGICTHLGGVVSWNSAEQTWDCPLHGSRYDREGGLRHGPAVSDLDPVDP